MFFLHCNYDVYSVYLFLLLLHLMLQAELKKIGDILTSPILKIILCVTIKLLST